MARRLKWIVLADGPCKGYRTLAEFAQGDTVTFGLPVAGGLGTVETHEYAIQPGGTLYLREATFVRSLGISSGPPGGPSMAGAAVPGWTP